MAIEAGRTVPVRRDRHATWLSVGLMAGCSPAAHPHLSPVISSLLVEAALGDVISFKTACHFRGRKGRVGRKIYCLAFVPPNRAKSLFFP